MWKCVKDDVEKLLTLCGKMCRKLRHFSKTSFPISDVDKKCGENPDVSRIFWIIHNIHTPYYNHTYH